MPETYEKNNEDTASAYKSLWTTRWKKRYNPWNGYVLKCTKCGNEIGSLSGQLPFCPSCDRAATTSAWNILIRRLTETELLKPSLKDSVKG